MDTGGAAASRSAAVPTRTGSGYRSFALVRFAAALAAMSRGAGNTPQRQHFTHEKARGFCRRSHPRLSGRHVVHHAARGRELRTLADGNVVREADLAAEHDIVPERTTSGNPALSGDEAMPSDGHVVADLHEIVDLG